MSEHRIELVQLFDAAQKGLQVPDLGGVRVLGSQLRDFNHKLLALREKLVKRRIQGAHDHRIAVHDLEEFDEVSALHGQQLGERSRARLIVFGEDHLAHVRDALRLEEHVLGAAQSDALRAERARRLGIARSLGIRAHTRLAVPVDELHELGKVARGRVGIDRGGLPGEHFARRAVNGNPVSSAQFVTVARDLAGLGIDVDIACSGHARRAHAARHDCGVRGHAAPRREDALGRFHAMNVFGGRFGAHEHDGTALGGLGNSVVGREHDPPDGGARRGGQTYRESRQLVLRRRFDDRMQELVQVLRLDAHDSLPVVDQALANHVHREFHCRGAGALAVASLEHVELAFLDRELEVLHVAIVLLQSAGDGPQLVVRLRERRLQFANRSGGADAGHDVLALRVQEELAVKLVRASGRIPSETDARRRRVAQVPEDHCLHVDGGAEVVGDVVHAPVVIGPRVVPGAKHGIASHLELLVSALREIRAERLLVVRLEGFHDLPQLAGGQVHVVLGAGLFLDAVQDFLELAFRHVHHDVSEHHDEAPVAIEREGLLAAQPRETFGGLVVQAEVEDGVHHARHREFRAGTHGEQERVRRVAQLLPHVGLETG